MNDIYSTLQLLTKYKIYKMFISNVQIFAMNSQKYLFKFAYYQYFVEIL